MIEPTKATVRPRVVVGGNRGIALLEDVVPEMAESGRVRSIELLGPPGFGTTTALQHIASIFAAESDWHFVDHKLSQDSKPQDVSGAIVFANNLQNSDSVVLQFRLAGWGRDEWIEYLLAAHKEQCCSVMSRVLHDPQIDSLLGKPSILRLVLDELAANVAVPDVESALANLAERLFPSHDLKSEMRTFAKLLITMKPMRPVDSTKTTSIALLSFYEQLDPVQLHLMTAPAVLVHFAADAVWQDLNSGIPSDIFRRQWPQNLINSVAKRLKQTPTAQAVLRRWIASEAGAYQPMAISLLHAIGVDWGENIDDPSTEDEKLLNLDGAILDGADCTQKLLAGCTMQNVSLANSDLSSVDLTYVRAIGAHFPQANLRRAQLNNFDGQYAEFAGATLCSAYGQEIQLSVADFTQADLTGVVFEDCDFTRARLHQAIFRDSLLCRCDFRQAEITKADFSNGDFKQSDLSDLDLTDVILTGSNFGEAKLSRCNLEGKELPDANFPGATLKGAIFTGSVMPRANFAAADLRSAKLAEIDWEFADLRDANLVGATFHMGSSRSGRVGSSIPMEGSRTGFYTDEYHEQDYKAPEEIRKANLRGADLRGANIDGVDFYLVDLRDAIYDDHQRKQLQRTGAILESKDR